LAVARAILQTSETGELSLSSGRWSEAAMLEDAWRLVDSDARELLRLLAAHVRPLDIGTLVSLGVNSDVIRRARASWLIEGSGERVWLARVWLAGVQGACDLRGAQECLASPFEKQVDAVGPGRHVAAIDA